LPAVFFFISGHGFGHASRQIEIVNALGRARPDVEIVIRTSAAAWLFEKTVSVPVRLIPGEADTGVVQIDSLSLDESATLDRAAAFYANLSSRAATEANLLRAHDARLVLSDAPPLACAAAALAARRAIVVSNFTWDWIYEAYEDGSGRASQVSNTVREAYRNADGAWRLPMYGGFETFDAIVDLPFVARHARHDRDHVRKVLGLPAGKPLALTSFGGYGVHESYLSKLDCLSECDVVVTAGVGSSANPMQLPGVHLVLEDALYAAGLRYEDLVAAVEVVVTKPGYGIIAECVANETAILYTSRGHFVEYDVLVSQMPRFLRCAFIDHSALFAGRWRSALGRLLSSTSPPERPPTNGAEVVAELIAAAI
jgi:hypothetical protein